MLKFERARYWPIVVNIVAVALLGLVNNGLMQSLDGFDCFANKLLVPATPDQGNDQLVQSTSDEKGIAERLYILA